MTPRGGSRADGPLFKGDQSACPKCRMEARKAMVKRIEVGEGQR